MTTTLNRFGAAVAAAGLILTASGSAVAATPPPTAELTGPTNVTPDVSSTFSFVVANPLATDGSLPAAVNTVRIIPPTEFNIDSGSSTDWTPRARTDRSMQFTAPASVTPLDSVAIAPGASRTFTVIATALPQAKDILQTWKVATSTNGGSTFSTAQAPAGKTLATTIRVLTVGAPTVIFVTPNKATTLQDTLSVTYPIANVGTAELTVTPSVTGTAGDGLVFDAAPLTLAAGASTTVTLPVKFGTVGTARRLTVGATSATGGLSSAITQATAAYDVVAAATYTLQTGAALTPSVARSADAPAFTVRVTQAAGTPSVTLSSLTTLAFTAAPRAPFSVSGPTTAATVPGDVAIGFPVTTIPGAAGSSANDGAYTSTLTIVGVDANGATVNKVVTPAGAFTIDNIAPITEAALSTPHRAGTTGDTVGDTSKPFVAKNGDTVTLSGAIRPATGSASTDSAATVDCTVIFNDGSAPVALPTCANTDGALTDEFTVAAPADATSGLVQVVTSDGAGNSSTAVTASFVIDNTAPVIDSAETGCVDPADTTACPSQFTQIRLHLTEAVYGTFTPADFSVTTDGAALPVQAVAFNGSDTMFGDTLTLTLATAMAEDALPTIAFSSKALPVNTAPADQAGAELTAADGLTAVDKIAPEVPQFNLVDSRSAYVGSYYTDTANPTYTLNKWSFDHTVRIYRETNGEPGLQADDALVCSGENTTPGGLPVPGSSTRTANCDTAADDPSLPNFDGSYTLYARATDPNGNTSRNVAGTVTFATATVVLDRSAPLILRAVGDATGVTVTFDGPLSQGRDNADDWLVTLGRTTFVVTSVTASSATTRRLAISDSDWTGSFDQVIYSCDSTNEDDYYGDLAGNRTNSDIYVKP